MFFSISLIALFITVSSRVCVRLHKNNLSKCRYFAVVDLCDQRTLCHHDAASMLGWCTKVDVDVCLVEGETETLTLLFKSGNSTY